jgi:hypothetical protein
MIAHLVEEGMVQLVEVLCTSCCAFAQFCSVCVLYYTGASAAASNARGLLPLNDSPLASQENNSKVRVSTFWYDNKGGQIRYLENPCCGMETRPLARRPIHIMNSISNIHVLTSHH